MERRHVHEEQKEAHTVVRFDWEATGRARARTRRRAPGT